MSPFSLLGLHLDVAIVPDGMINLFMSHVDAGQKLSQPAKMRFYTYLIEYEAYGIEPSFDKEGSKFDRQIEAVWTAIYPNLRISKARKEAGRKGGMAKAANAAKGDLLEDLLASKSLPTSTSTSTSTSSKNPHIGEHDDGDGDEGDDHIPYETIVNALNEAAGTSYKPTTKETRRLIKARWNEGFRVKDFEAVCEKKAAQWKGDAKFAKYLRPQTLFGSKFESYLNEAEPNGGGRDAASEYGSIF